MNIAIPNVREGLLSFDFVKNLAQFYDISGLEMTTKFSHFSFKSKLSQTAHLEGQNQKSKTLTLYIENLPLPTYLMMCLEKPYLI